MLNFNRDIYLSLDNWSKSPVRRPLLVRGARQVGKSYAIREWIKKNFSPEKSLEINFEASPSYAATFEKDLSADKILTSLNLSSGINLKSENAILFLDEIQCCPRAITALRYFYEQVPTLRVIAAGSLLEFVLDQISFPVGRVQSMFMFPLSFKEMLAAIGKANLYKSLELLSIDEEIPTTVHEELLLYMKLYYQIGGMPSAIKAYVTSNDLKAVSHEHSVILQTYQDDLAKYSKNIAWETLEIVYRRLPHVVCTTNIKYVNIDRDHKSEKIKGALRLFKYARLINQVSASITDKPPLVAGQKAELFKLIFLDLGLLQHALGFDWRALSPDYDLCTVANGRFAEQFVGQELLANKSGHSEYQLHYWNRPQQGAESKIDYLVERNQEIVPVEVKSGKQGSLKSLHQYLKQYPQSEALVLYQGNLKQMNRIKFMPLYLAGKI